MLSADHSGQVWPVGAALWWEDRPFSVGGQGRLEIPSERCLCSALAFLLTVQGLLEIRPVLGLGDSGSWPPHSSGDHSPEDQSTKL